MLSDNAEGDLIHFALLADIEPIDYKEAMKEQAWKNAMIEKLKAIERNHNWELTKLDLNKKPIEVKWVFKLKLNPDGSIARLVVKGFLQKLGVDYKEVFAPVARIETIRLVVALASKIIGLYSI